VRDFGSSSLLLFALSDAALSSAAEKEGFNGTLPVIVGNVGWTSLTNVGLELILETAKVGVKGGVAKDALGDFVGLAVGDLVGLVPGIISGQVRLQTVCRLQ